MQTTTLRPDQLQSLLTTLEADYRQLIASHRSTWRSADDRALARQALIGSVANARQAVQSLQETTDPELRPLMSQLIVQSELAAGTLKDLSVLRY